MGEHALQQAGQTGDEADLGKVIRLLQRAIDVAPSVWWKRPWVLNNLGSALQTRGRSTGDLTDLNRAVEVLEDAARSVPSNDPQRCGLLMNLRGALHARFDRAGDTADLDRAVEVLEEEARLTPSDDPNRVVLFRTLHAAHRARFERTDDIAVLNRAIKVLEAAASAAPTGSSDRRELAEQTIRFLGALDVVQGGASESDERQAAGDAMQEVLAWLADNLTTLVLDRLGYTSTPPAGAPWPRVWWCTSGVLSLLPIHAAGRHPAPSSGATDAVIDRVISSNIPTLGALLHARVTPAIQPEPGLLVVAMPHTPNQLPLPGVATEAATVQQLWPGQSTVLGLPGAEAATSENVMANLPSHPWVHYACHGNSDLTDPSASHLLLADGALSVTDLARIHLPDAQLAFLSACTTARTGIALPDEPIHMAAACQLAGYRSVAASLWPISDIATVALASTFYARLIAEQLRDPAAALHQATRQLRDDAPSRPDYWAPYIHTGP